MNKKWLFGFGTYRSGQNALVKIINAHPDAHILHEAFIWGYADIMKKKQYTMALDFSDQALPSHMTSTLDIRNHCINIGSNFLSDSMVRNILKCMREQVSNNAILFGDIRRQYCRYMDDILNVFPDCKVVKTKRSIWGIASSLIYHNWWRNPQHSQMEYAEEMLQIAKKAHDEAFHDQKSNVVCHEVKFEDMADDNKKIKIVEGLLDYLELSKKDYDWSVLDTTRYHTSLNRWKEISELQSLYEQYKNEYRCSCYDF